MLGYYKTPDTQQILDILQSFCTAFVNDDSFTVSVEAPSFTGLIIAFDFSARLLAPPSG